MVIRIRISRLSALFIALFLLSSVVLFDPSRSYLTIASGTCPQQNFYLFNDPSRGTFKLINCSNAPTTGPNGQTAGTINNILSNTDAAYSNLLTSSGVYLANNQWVIWIDEATSPGIIRGLWPIYIDAQNKAQSYPWTEPKLGGRLRSFLQINQGYSGDGAPSRQGYRGLHVEIWRFPDDGINGPYYEYTYPNRGASEKSISGIGSGAVTLNYAMILRNLADTTDIYVHPDNSNIQSRLRYYIAYHIRPDHFQIETALGSISTTNLSSVTTRIAGDAAGLVLLTGHACERFTNCRAEYSYSLVEMRRNSFTIIEASNPLNIILHDGAVWISNFSNDVAMLDESRPSPLPPPYDRYVSTEAPYNYASTWSLKSSGGSPIWYITPDWPGVTTNWTRLTAYHYNNTTTQTSGLTGVGAFDVLLRGRTDAPLTVSNEDQLHWRVTFTHS